MATTPSHRNGSERYTVRVNPVPQAAQWRVRLELADATGAIVDAADVEGVVFDTAAQAEAAGWQLADEWMQRMHALRVPIGFDERTLLVGCAHAVARCPACALSHTFRELAGERLCARCHADLTIALRIHLNGCTDIAIRRSHAAVRTAELAGTRNREIRDATEVALAESEVPRGSAQRTRQRPPGRTCPVCEQPLEPGQGVSFQRGELIHLTCYEKHRRR